MAERTLRTMETARFEKKVADLVRRLHEMAEEVEHEGNRPKNSVNCPEYGWRAQQIIHTIMWGLANANLDGLALCAAEVDTSDIVLP